MMVEHFFPNFDIKIKIKLIVIVHYIYEITLSRRSINLHSFFI